MEQNSMKISLISIKMTEVSMKKIYVTYKLAKKNDWFLFGLFADIFFVSID
jgi:hypothetical protein